MTVEQSKMHWDLAWQSMALEKVKRKNLFSSQKAVCSSDFWRAVDSKHGLWAYAGGKLPDWGVNPALCSRSARSWGQSWGRTTTTRPGSCARGGWSGPVAGAPCPDTSPGRGEAAEWHGAASESRHLLGQGSFLIYEGELHSPLWLDTGHGVYTVQTRLPRKEPLPDEEVYWAKKHPTNGLEMNNGQNLASTACT